MVDNPPALEQHHCDAGANFVRIVLRPDACAESVNAYRKIDLTTDYADNTDRAECVEGLPTKHSKKVRRMQLIFVSFRLFSGPENFICHSSQSLRHPRHSRAELWEQRDRRKSRDG
jgi:hypothetical protein